VHQAVHHERPFDVLLSANLFSYLGATDDVGDRNDGKNSVCNAALSDLLGDLAFDVARHEVRNDAERAVVKAAAQTVLEFRHLPRLSRPSLRRETYESEYGS